MCINFIFGFAQKSTDKTIITLLKVLGWVFLLGFIGLLGYNIYYYFFIYTVQYSEWLFDLPSDGKEKIAVINSMRTLINNLNNNRRNNYSTNPSGITINL